MSKVTAKLKHYLYSGRVPHGFLFCGEPRKTAEAEKELSAFYLCAEKDNKPCGVCGACLKLENSSHPDLINVKALMPEGKYKVDELRQLIAASSFRPNDGEVKVYIFEELHLMNTVCQNALLKFIEEPFEFNRFIFTAETASGILETVISRLAVIEFAGEHDYAVVDETLISSVKAIAEGLAAGDEYMTASAFAKLGSRDAQKRALELLEGVLRDGLVYKYGAAFLESCCKDKAQALSKADARSITAAIERIRVFTEKTVYNPNANLAAAAYASGIFSDYSQIPLGKE